MNNQLHALQQSVSRLRSIVDSLQPSQLSSPAYPTEWTIADTLSHIGSGAVITRSAIEAAASGTPVVDGFNQSVWDEWNAKSPADQAADTLVSDQALLDRIAELSDDQQASMQFSIGPMSLDFSSYLAMRLAEHALHTWDVEVTVDAAATLSADAAGVILDLLPMIARFAAKPDGSERNLVIRTAEPSGGFILTTTVDGVSLASSDNRADGPTAVDTDTDTGTDTDTDTGTGTGTEIAAEAFVRLVYGRLDPANTPTSADTAEIASLRPLFPGF